MRCVAAAALDAAARGCAAAACCVRNSSTSSSVRLSPASASTAIGPLTRHARAGFGDDPPQHSVARCLDVMGRLVGLGHEQRLPRLHTVALGTQPLGDGAGLHRQPPLGELYENGHTFVPDSVTAQTISRTASATPLRARDIGLLQRWAERDRRMWRRDALDRTHRGCRSPRRRQPPRSSPPRCTAGCPRQRSPAGGSCPPTRGWRPCPAATASADRRPRPRCPRPRAGLPPQVRCGPSGRCRRSSRPALALDVGAAEGDR